MSSWCGDFETYDVQVNESPRARKPRKCMACKETIRVGDRYYRFKGLFDRKWDVYERCARCQKLFDHLSDRMRGDSEEFCDPLLNCGHTYQERWREEPPPEIAALAFALPGEVP